MRLTDANNLILWLNDVWYSSFMYEESPTSIAVKDVMKAVEEYVKDAPTIDAVEVVRCKDCVRKQEWLIDYTHDSDWFCTLHECAMNDDDFCSCGEREEREVER